MYLSISISLFLCRSECVSLSPPLRVTNCDGSLECSVVNPVERIAFAVGTHCACAVGRHRTSAAFCDREQNMTSHPLPACYITFFLNDRLQHVSLCTVLVCSVCSQNLSNTDSFEYSIAPAQKSDNSRGKEPLRVTLTDIT